MKLVRIAALIVTLFKYRWNGQRCKYNFTASAMRLEFTALFRVSAFDMEPHRREYKTAFGRRDNEK